MLGKRVFACILGAVIGVSLSGVVLASGSSQDNGVSRKTEAKVEKRHLKSSVGAAKTGKARLSQRKAVYVGKSRSAFARQPDAGRLVRTVQHRSMRSEEPFEVVPRLRSAAFFVQNVATGQVVLEKNSDAVQPIASITKLMTIMVVLDARQDLQQELEVTEDDVDHLKNSSSHLPVGTVLTRQDLMHLALMASENRAASALARNYPGGMPAFLQAMNTKARLMGLQETHFSDGTGLTTKNVSSARDLAVLVTNASHYPLIREFSTSSEYTVALKHGRLRTFHNTNSLVRNPGWQIDVSKTGFINESGRCLVMQAWFNNKQLAIVLLDSVGHYTRIGDANRIRKWLDSPAGRQAVAASSVASDVSASM